MCSQYGISESSSIVILQAKLSIELQKQSCSAISTDKSKRTLTPSTTALRGLSLSSVVAAQWPASRRNRHRTSIQWLMTRVMGGEISFPCHSQRQICAVLCVNLMKNFSRRGAPARIATPCPGTKSSLMARTSKSPKTRRRIIGTLSQLEKIPQWEEVNGYKSLNWPK